jgi:hypothetical protein
VHPVTVDFGTYRYLDARTSAQNSLPLATEAFETSVQQVVELPAIRVPAGPSCG